MWPLPKVRQSPSPSSVAVCRRPDNGRTTNNFMLLLLKNSLSILCFFHACTLLDGLLESLPSSPPPGLLLLSLLSSPFPPWLSAPKTFNGKGSKGSIFVFCFECVACVRLTQVGAAVVVWGSWVVPVAVVTGTPSLWLLLLLLLLLLLSSPERARSFACCLLLCFCFDKAGKSGVAGDRGVRQMGLDRWTRCDGDGGVLEESGCRGG